MLCQTLGFKNFTISFFQKFCRQINSKLLKPLTVYHSPRHSYLGDLELKPSTFLITDPLLGLLKIQETQDLDAGDYTCVAVNDAGRATGRITLDVGCK